MRINYKSGLVSCAYVGVAECDFIINFCTLDFDNGGFVDDGLKKFTLAHVVVCPQGCDGLEICERSQKHVKVFEKEYENICISPLQIINPDTTGFEYAKKLILMVKQNRDGKLGQMNTQGTKTAK